MTNPAPTPDATPALPLLPAVRELRGFPLGTILLRLGFLPEEAINEALAAAEAERRPLGRLLVDRGLIGEAQLAHALATQKGLPFVDAVEIAPDAKALELLPAHAAHTLGALPLGLDGR